ncbi:hypothetical protein BX600DRAFT_504446 [Xylariales sp. PMI_506]|nr:hypothetical protein BX600DRAFT_504446 [Xylariales sp. PMI_506]
MATDLIHMPLSPMDYVPGTIYPAAVLYFPLKQGTSPQQVFAHLHEGLRRTFLQVPWLNGRLYLQSQDSPGWRPGQLEIRYRPVSSELSALSQFRFNEPPFTGTYEDIRAGGFAPHSFEDEELLYKPFVSHDMTEGTEVIAAQANFIPGACLLAFAPVHSACDATGGASILRLWGENCRSISAQSPEPTIQLERWDHTIMEHIWLQESKVTCVQMEHDPRIWHMVAQEPPIPTSVQEDSSVPTINSEDKTITSRMFYISPKAFTALRKTSIEGSSDMDISGNDILMALIWRHVSKVRSSGLIAEDMDGISELMVTIDGRFAFSDSMMLPYDYIGNVVFHYNPSLPLRELIAPETTITRVAQEIRTSAQIINHQTMMEAYALLRDLPDYKSRKRIRKSRMLISSMLAIPDEYDFGDAGPFANGGQPECSRHITSTRCQFWHPACFVSSRRKSGGIEFMLTLTEAELELLLRDSEFTRYVFLLA